VTVGGKRLTYDAHWSDIEIAGSDGTKYGTVSATSYLRTNVDNSSQRPVVFAFGGGPGASGSNLNFNLLGPKRWSDTRGIESRSELNRHGKLVDNEVTLLDAADLVLIDTPGSGFSRPLRPNGLSYFWTAPRDAEAVETYIRRWLTDNGRTSSPVYILGESYGGYRIAVMAPHLADLDVAGLVMISPALDMTDQPGTSGIPDEHFVFNFPTMAVAAWTQHRVKSDTKTAEEVFAEAAGFAQKELLVALQLGSNLAPSERDRLASQMSRMIGLPAQDIAQANLRIDPQEFLETLVPGRVVGRLDTRVTGPAQREAVVAGRTKQADDPALGIGASNIHADPAVGDYLRSIGVKTTAPYISLNLEMNFNLDWAYGSRKFEDVIRLNPTPNIATLLEKRPHLQVLLIGGYYDMTIPILQPRYAITHAGIPLRRVRMVAFEGPHAVYSDPSTRKPVAAEIRTLVGRRLDPLH
jgi:carboxypeptidase C (cathepsin A)